MSELNSLPKKVTDFPDPGRITTIGESTLVAVEAIAIITKREFNFVENDVGGNRQVISIDAAFRPSLSIVPVDS